MNPLIAHKAASAAYKKLHKTVPDLSLKWHGWKKAKPSVARKIKQIRNVRQMSFDQYLNNMRYVQKRQRDLIKQGKLSEFAPYWRREVMRGKNRMLGQQNMYEAARLLRNNFKHGGHVVPGKFLRQGSIR